MKLVDLTINWMNSDVTLLHVLHDGLSLRYDKLMLWVFLETLLRRLSQNVLLLPEPPYMTGLKENRLVRTSQDSCFFLKVDRYCNYPILLLQLGLQDASLNTGL